MSKHVKGICLLVLVFKLCSYSFHRDPNGKETETWPRFTIDSQKHININKENTVGQYLYNKEVNFWREIVPLVMSSLDDAHSSESPFSKKLSDTCEKDGTCG